MDPLHNLDWFLSIRTPALTTLAFALTWLGYATFIMFFMAVGYWAWSKAIFFRVLVLITISAILNAYAKDIFQSPRPPLTIRLDDLVGDSYGIPSGHAQMAVVLWMWLAYEVRRKWMWVACSIITLGVILSRMYLAAHYPIDVLVGTTLGAATLAVFVWVKDRQWSWQTNPVHSLLALMLAMAVVLSTWPNGRVAPDYVPMLAGWLAGAIIGLHVERRTLDFAAPTQCWRKAAAAAVGVVAFIALQKILKLVGAQLNWTPPAWDATKGLIAGFFITLPMPWLLVKMKLASNPVSPAN